MPLERLESTSELLAYHIIDVIQQLFARRQAPVVIIGAMPASCPVVSWFRSPCLMRGRSCPPQSTVHFAWCALVTASATDDHCCTSCASIVQAPQVQPPQWHLRATQLAFKCA